MRHINIDHAWHVLRGGKPLSYFNRVYLYMIIPALVLVYNLMPKKLKPIVLLLASFIFFWLFSQKLLIFLIISIISIFLAGLFMNKLEEEKEKELKKAKKELKKEIKNKYKNKKKLVLIIAILLNVSFLIFFKYLPFFKMNGNLLLKLLHIKYTFKIVNHIAPIGISFYTLEAISYIADIYNGKIKADKNIIRLALYLSFLPQIMEGPIARYSDTAESLYEGQKITYKNFCFGYQRIFYGVLKKSIIANRLNFMVKLVFDNYASYSAIANIFAIVGYTLMLYTEFSGTMDIVIGSGEIFGVKIPENFRQPFFAKNISEFWTRWHISLGLWFKDYIFYPVSLSKSMKKLTLKARNLMGNRFGPLVSGAIALFAVWFLNGLWHGAGYTFLFYGMYQFILILLGNIFEPTINNICKKIKINRQNKIYRVFQSIKMTFFVFIGELFFRATSVKAGFGMLKKIFTNFHLISTFKSGEFLKIGLDGKDYVVIFIALIVVFIISLLKEKNHNIREEINQKNICIKWIIYYLLILSIIIFGAYGFGYLPVDPIYADF